MPITFLINPFLEVLVIPETITSPSLYPGFKLKIILSSVTLTGCFSLLVSDVITFTFFLTIVSSFCLLRSCNLLYPNITINIATNNTTKTIIVLRIFFFIHCFLLRIFNCFRHLVDVIILFVLSYTVQNDNH